MSDKENVPGISDVLGKCTGIIETLGSEMRQSTKEHRQELAELRQAYQTQSGSLTLAVIGLAVIVAVQAAIIGGMFRSVVTRF